MFRTIKKFLLDLFFPKSCLGCGKTKTYICQSCQEKITSDGLICQKRCERSSLNRLIWAVPYSNPFIKELIKIFKYHYVKELAQPLGQFLIKCETSHIPLNAIIVPVPLHKRKLRERGFNQAELLAKEVAEYFSLSLETKALIRKKYTPPQVRTKNHKARRESLKNAFGISSIFTKKCISENTNLLKEKTIILIDDVTTTGATLFEAARVLKRAGAKEVWGLVVAKG